jgi:hypothetical protein
VNPLYLAVAERAENRCEYCRASEQVFNFNFEVEHILPRSSGGGSEADNIALACESCNLHKASTIEAWDEVEERSVPLFHPRQDRWEAHFRYDSASAHVVGLTATGRVTVMCLKINSAFQLRARRHWLHLNLYP